MKRVLISVYDKTGILTLAKVLHSMDWEILSTGGTADHLQANGIPVTAVDSLTEFPEILDGRVKTLHPRIFGGILAKDNAAHRQELASIGAAFIDMVVCNLYPFEKTVEQNGDERDTCIEMIDVGGPSMVRAAAKNYQRTTVLCDPMDYSRVTEELADNQIVSLRTRSQLAAKAFAHTAAYDAAIAAYLREEQFPQRLTLPLEKVQDLRYGENPHQNAAFYRDTESPGLAHARQLHGKELSFNNIYDADAAWQMASAFAEPCAVAVKHTNPCGWAIGITVEDAYRKAFDADPVSIFGGIVAVNRVVTAEAAENMSKTFLEVIIAPGFAPEALTILQRKKNVRLLQLDPAEPKGWDMKRVCGGLLLQQRDNQFVESTHWIHAAGPTPDSDLISELEFAWTCVKYVKSNAIVVTNGRQLLGVGAGQMNRVQSMQLALQQADMRAQGAVVGSDAFFPFADSIDAAAAAGIRAVVQPGGSKRDDEVKAACAEHGISLLLTGVRHFRH